MNEERYLAMLFCDTFKKKVNTKQFMVTMGQAKSLLELYTVEEIEIVIKYLSLHPPKDGVYSFGFIPCVMSELLPKAKAIEMRRKEEQEFKAKEVSISDLSEINAKKYNKANNDFAKRGMVDF